MAVQWDTVLEIADQSVRQQAGSGVALWQQAGRSICRLDAPLFTARAGIQMTHVVFDVELGRNELQPFTGLGADACFGLATVTHFIGFREVLFDDFTG